MTSSDIDTNMENRTPSKYKASTINPVLKTALIGIFTAVEAVVTASLPIVIPASEGYFNFGEAIIYVVAILFGPGVGAIVGGVGAGIADIFTGYVHYAPGTLLIKGLEGFLVGYIFRVIRKSDLLKKQWKLFLFLLGGLFGGLMIVLGWKTPLFIILGIVLMIGIWLIGFLAHRDLSQKLIPMFFGGIVMVLGYFLYEIPLYGLQAAFIEMPFNGLQVLLGISIAIPIISALEPAIKKLI